MKKRACKTASAFVCFFILLSLNFTHSQELADFGIGARGLGLGRVGVTLLSDADSIFLNPASVYLVKNKNHILSYYSPADNELRITIAMAIPQVLDNTFGVGYELRYLSNVATTSEVLSYAAHELLFSYAISPSENLILGGSAKFFSKAYSKDIVALRGGVGAGMDLDAGVRFSPDKNVSVGLMLQNFLPSSLMGKIILANKKEEALPCILKAGTHVKLFGEDTFTAGMDFEYSVSRKAPFLARTGIEYKPLKLIAFRGGIDQTEKTETSTNTNLALGIGLVLDSFTFDCSYYKYEDTTRNPIIAFSIGYKEPPKEIIIPQIAVVPIPAVKKIKKLKRKQFIDVPKNYWAKDPIELLATANLLSGYHDKYFRPKKQLTRADFSIMIINAKKLSLLKVKAKVFEDVPVKSPVARQIMAVKNIGAMTGYPDWKFRPYRAITRAEAVKVLAVFDGLTITKGSISVPYQDVTPESWAMPYLSAAYNSMIISKNEKFDPNKPITRAEVAWMLYKTSFGQNAIRNVLKLLE